MIATSLFLPGLALALVLLVQETEPEEPEDLSPRVAELYDEVAHVPFTLDGGRPIPLIEAMVNGRGPFRFFYDTGASVCVFDSGFVEELGIPTLGTTEIGDHTANARISADCPVELGTAGPQ